MRITGLPNFVSHEDATAAEMNALASGIATAFNNSAVLTDDNSCGPITVPYTWTGALTLNGGLTMGSSISFSTDGTFDIGAAGARPRNITLSGTVTAGGITVTGAITAATLTGTLSTAAQPNVTSVGTLTALLIGGAGLSIAAGGVHVAAGSALLDTGATLGDSLVMGLHQITANNYQITGAGALTLNGGASIAGAVTISGLASLNNSAAVTGTLGVTGASTLAALTVNGATTHNAGVTITAGGITVTGTTTLNSGLNVTGGVGITGNTSMTGALGVGGNINMSGGATISGNFLWNADAGGNIGASGANRPNNIYAAGTIYSASSRVLKENIRPTRVDALDIVRKTRVVDFTYKKMPSRPKIGFIAEDTHELLSGPSHTDFDINNSIGVLLAAVQQLDGDVRNLRAQLLA